ncbi:MAG: NAD(P)H-dependent glycerol-3-phosphate dehydrogenase [Eubacteriales bacterium]|nr:NAD(P)H-dependent glycerol-3-phosphate dehydrogenase [Eubacteriales bacterium]
MKTLVLGTGTFGCALANHLSEKGVSVAIWGRDDEATRTLMQTRVLPSSLNGKTLHEDVAVSTDLASAIADRAVLVLAVPSVAVREVAQRIRPFYKNQILVVVAKGLEEESHMTMDEILRETLETDRIAVLSGPTHAEEVAANLPSSCVIGAANHDIAVLLQDLFMSETFRVYTSEDVKGIELGGALKNIIALAAGMSDGLGYGDNAKAALITRGIVEITRLGVALGARPETFGGLTGIGDLIVTCASRHSRNRKAGYLLGCGKSLDEALAEVGMVVEGVNALHAAYDKARALGVDTPIINAVYDVLYNGLPVTEVAKVLISREKKRED